MAVNSISSISAMTAAISRPQAPNPMTAHVMGSSVVTRSEKRDSSTGMRSPAASTPARVPRDDFFRKLRREKEFRNTIQDVELVRKRKKDTTVADQWLEVFRAEEIHPRRLISVSIGSLFFRRMPPWSHPEIRIDSLVRLLPASPWTRRLQEQQKRP